MKCSRRLAVFLLAPLAALSAAGQALQPLMLVPDQIVYQDSFATNRALDTTVWKAAQNTRWAVADGVLRGRPSTPEFYEALAKLPPAESKTIRQKTPGQLAKEKTKPAGQPAAKSPI